MYSWNHQLGFFPNQTFMIMFIWWVWFQLQNYVYLCKIIKHFQFSEIIKASQFDIRLSFTSLNRSRAHSCDLIQILKQVRNHWFTYIHTQSAKPGGGLQTPNNYSRVQSDIILHNFQRPFVFSLDNQIPAQNTLRRKLPI